MDGEPLPIYIQNRVIIIVPITLYRCACACSLIIISPNTVVTYNKPKLTENQNILLILMISELKNDVSYTFRTLRYNARDDYHPVTED